MFRSTGMYFYIRLQDVNRICPEVQGCTSISVYTQCGFASCEIGNKLTEEQQWAKLKLVKEIAEEVWA